MKVKLGRKVRFHHGSGDIPASIHEVRDEKTGFCVLTYAVVSDSSYSSHISYDFEYAYAAYGPAIGQWDYYD